MRPYLLSLSTVLVFLGVTYYLETLASGGVFFLLLLAVLLSGWYGGLGPGLTAAVISAVSGTYLFLPPHYAMTIERPADLMRLILFCGASVLVLTLTEQCRRMTAKLAHRNAELEHEMCERRHIEQTLHDRQAALQTLTQAVPGILSTFLPDGRCEYYSQRFYDYTGLSPEDGAGEGWIRAIHPDDRGGTIAAWRTCVEKGKPFEREYRLSSAVGAARWFLTRIVPQVDAHGRIVRWHGVSVDITEQKEAEATLQAMNHDLEERVCERTAALTEANRKLTQEIFEHRDASDKLSYIQQQLLAITSQAPVGIFLADWQGDWEFANEWWRETTGLTVDETKGSGWLRVVHPADRDRLEAAWYTAARDERSFRAEYRITTPAGTVAWMLQTAVILPGYGYAGTVMDMTGQKQAEEMLKLHRDDLEKRVAERTAALQEQVEMLEQFSDVAVLRELRMMALEKELEAMKDGKQNGKG